MIAIVCIDNAGGMCFNNRRQSRDSHLLSRILSVSQNSKLFMNEYSYKLFQNINNCNITSSEEFLEIASDGDSIFVENKKLSEYENKIEKIILYKWNRDYPSDFYFDINLENWKLESIYEFEGSSHEKITEEIYIK